VDDEGGNFTSPNYPNFYPYSVYCSWIFKPSNISNSSLVVTFEIVSLVMFGDVECLSTYLYVNGSLSELINPSDSWVIPNYLTQKMSLRIFFFFFFFSDLTKVASHADFENRGEDHRFYCFIV
jgi:hypothetical protein